MLNSELVQRLRRLFRSPPLGGGGGDKGREGSFQSDLAIDRSVGAGLGEKGWGNFRGFCHAEESAPLKKVPATAEELLAPVLRTPLRHPKGRSEGGSAKPDRLRWAAFIHAGTQILGSQLQFK